MDSTLKTKLLFEISQIDKLLNDSKPLLDLYKIKTPDFKEGKIFLLKITDAETIFSYAF